MNARLRAAAHRGRVPLLSAVVVVIAFLAAGGASSLSRYDTQIAITLLAYFAIAQGWNILAGFGGEISLGVSAFVGTGAYTVGIVMLHTDLGWRLSLLVAVAAGTALALLLAVPLLRLRGHYFAIGTLAASLALQSWLINWDYAGGSAGINLPVLETPEGPTLYRTAVLVAALAMVVAVAVRHSGFGLRLMAVRDHEAAADALGVSAFRHRLGALVISSALTALAGGVIALQQSSFEPVGMVGVNWTINALLMVTVGGTATLLGPALGTVIVYYVLTKQLEQYPTLGLIIEGVLLVLIVRFAPQGVWPTVVSLCRWARARIRPTTRSSTAAGPGEPADAPVPELSRH